MRSRKSASHFLLYHSTVEEGDDLSSRAVLTRTEGSGRGTGGDTVFYRPQYSVVIEIALFDVDKINGGFLLGNGLAVQQGITYRATSSAVRQRQRRAKAAAASAPP